MKQLFLTVVLSFSFILNAFSQDSQLLDGFILDLKKDTIKGKVFFEDWAISPSKITFQDKNKVDISYSPEQILGFGISSKNEMYDSKKILINYVTKAPIEIGKSPFRVSETLEVFMQKILFGNHASIYKYIDKEGIERFFVEKDNDLLELVNYTFTQINNGTNYLIKDDTYKKQLKNICSDADNFNASIPLYQESSIKNYFSKYNACFMGNSISYSNNVEKPKYSIGITGGVNNLTSSSKDFLTNKMYGFSFRLLLPRLFYNRFVKFYFLNTPNFTILNTDTKNIEQNNISEYGLTFGRYIGKKKIQPMASFTLNYVGNYGELNTGINLGVCYDKKIELEINRIVTIFGPSYLQSPKISLTYFLSFPNQK